MRWELPAKLNWSLEVLGRRADGFHEIRSWFVAVGLCDSLEAEAAEPGPSRLEVAGPGGVPEGPENLVLRAEAAWRAAGGQAPAVSWRLVKRIPAAAGLGGGSADAAGALRSLERLATRPLGLRDCLGVAAATGSDVPFFFAGEGAECRGGRGERLLVRAAPPPLWVVLALPPAAVPTAGVYAALEAPGCSLPAEAPDAPGFPARPGPNHLEEAAYALHPALQRFAEGLRARADFRMSGSGGAHFSPAAGEAEARRLAEQLAAEGVEALAVPLRRGPVVQEETACR